VERALRKAGRADLIGTGKNCLIKPSPATLIKQAQSGRNGAKKNARPGANRSGGRKPGGNSQRRKHK